MKLLKVVFLGEEDAGKEELREKGWLGLKPKWANQMGSDFIVKDIEVQNEEEKCQIIIKLWDIAGHERFKSVRDIYYHGANAGIVLFDITRPETFERCSDWIKELWVNNGSGACPVVLVGNGVQRRKKVASIEKSTLVFKKEEFMTNHKDPSTNKKVTVPVPVNQKKVKYIPAAWANKYASEISKINNYDTPYIELDTTEQDLSHLDEMLYLLGSLCMKLTLPSVEEIPISDRGVFAKRRIKQLIVDAGAMRVSKNAITMLNNILFEKGIILAKRSIRFAKHAKRKTIKEEDIIMANQ